MTLDRANISVWLAISVAILLFGVALAGYRLWYEASTFAIADDAVVQSDASATWIAANASQGSVTQIRLGQTAEVHLGVLGLVATGRVVEMPDVGTDQTGPGDDGHAPITIPVKIVLDANPEGLCAGMSAYVKIRVR